MEKPFGKIFLQYGNPIQFNLDDDFETCKEALSQAMDDVENRNKNYVKNII